MYIVLEKLLNFYKTKSSIIIDNKQINALFDLKCYVLNTLYN